MILANGCNITKSEKFKGVWILSVTTVYVYGNIPAEDNEEITSLPLSSAFQTTT